MAPKMAVKPDPTLWQELLSEYDLTVLPHDTVLRGRLRDDLTATSPEVLAALEQWSEPAYFHADESGTEVVLVYQIKEERPEKLWLHLALFLATLVTTLGAGALMVGRDAFGTEAFTIGGIQLPYPTRIEWAELVRGAPFAIPFLTVLMAHEMGHYAAARLHRVRASLPYFIPFPPYFSVIGTVGAFIRLRGPIVRRSVLFDIGASGPVASFLGSLPLLAIGLMLSDVAPGPVDPSTPFLIHFAGESVWLGNGMLVNQLAEWFGPAPVGAAPIALHPLALVGWLGLFVTTLNLLPLGQLDGGHVLFALRPGSAGLFAWAFLIALVPLGFVWWGWWAWAVVVLVVNRGRIRHPRVVQGEAPIGGVRGLLGWALIAVFFMTFVPVPIRL